MNTKVAVGLVAAIILLVVAFFIFQKSPSAPAAFSPESTGTSTTATNSPSLAPLQASSTAAQTAPAKQPTAPARTPHVAVITQSSLVSHSMNPVITGSSNMASVGIVIDDPSGTGIIGVSNIPVTKGQWSYTVSRGLAPGVYTVHLIGNDTPVTAKLTVLAP